MDCPKCLGKMKQLAIPASGRLPEVRVERCPICGGIWFDKDELPELITRELLTDTRIDIELDSGVEDEELLEEIGLDTKPAECPLCGPGRKLSREKSPRNHAVHIDYCGHCGGIWLDRGEYEKLSEHPLVERNVQRFFSFLRSRFPGRFK